MDERTSEQRHWQQALEAGAFGVWDLNPVMELVHYSPQWKARLGFPRLLWADSTAFWRCRVHPEDLASMLERLRAHLDGFTSTYETRFRLRSNGSGYRTVLSRGRVVQRDHRGNATRMVGTMLDLTDRPATPLQALFTDERAPQAAGATALPFHAVLGLAPTAPLIAQVHDLLQQAWTESRKDGD